MFFYVETKYLYQVEPESLNREIMGFARISVRGNKGNVRVQFTGLKPEGIKRCNVGIHQQLAKTGVKKVFDKEVELSGQTREIRCDFDLEKEPEEEADCWFGCILTFDGRKYAEKNPVIKEILTKQEESGVTTETVWVKESEIEPLNERSFIGEEEKITEEICRESVRVEEIEESVRERAGEEEIGEAMRESVRVEEIEEAVRESARAEKIGEAVRKGTREEEIEEISRERAETEEIEEAMREGARVEKIGEAMRAHARAEEIGEAVRESAREEEIRESVNVKQEKESGYLRQEEHQRRVQKRESFWDRIYITDLNKLGKCNQHWERWRQNSFLLHGYYNYNHIIAGSSFLGVPGNFYEREKQVAAMFGFPLFIPVKEIEAYVFQEAVYSDRTFAPGTFGYYMKR